MKHKDDAGAKTWYSQWGSRDAPQTGPLAGLDYLEKSWVTPTGNVFEFVIGRYQTLNLNLGTHQLLKHQR